MKDKRVAVRLDIETYEKVKDLATEGNISQLIRLIVKNWLEENDPTTRLERKLSDLERELKK
jgi:hypothetical protein